MNSNFNAEDEIASSNANKPISPGQANLIKNEAVIGSYSYAIVDHSCSFLNEGCESGFSIWWLFNGALFFYAVLCG